MRSQFRSFFHCAQKWCGVRLVPEVSIFRLRRKNRAGDPFLCFVLHRTGFLMRPRLHEGPVGSYPAFSTLPRTTFRRQRALNFAVSLRPKVVRGGIFSVILSVPWSFRPKLPRFREACCLLVFGLSSGTKRLHQRPPVTALFVARTAKKVQRSRASDQRDRSRDRITRISRYCPCLVRTIGHPDGTVNRFPDACGLKCANFPVLFSREIAGYRFREKCLACLWKNNIVPALPRLAEEEPAARAAFLSPDN